MAERRINMNNKVENFKWHSLLDMSGKGLHKFNAVGKDTLIITTAIKNFIPL